MNRTSPPQTDAVPLDRVLTDYFRAELPQSWPAPPHPAGVRTHASGGRWRNLFTLAASVAALLVFGFALSYGPTAGGPKPSKDGDLLNGSTADGDKLKSRMIPTDPMNR